MPLLQDRTVLITGAARGIGAACAAAAAREGARVYVTDIDEHAGRAVAASLAASGAPETTFIRLDVRRENDWDSAVDLILGERPALDALVNNAGITGVGPGLPPGDPEHATLDAWRAVHATNLEGVFLGCRAMLRAARRQSPNSGAIVNISSRSGVVGIPGAAAYASSKAAVRNHTKTVALYAAEQGLAIRCNSVHPGAILTPMWDDVLPSDGQARRDALDSLSREVPLGRMGSPGDVAELVIFLVSDRSAYITGAELMIDGGIVAGTAASPPRPEAR